MRLYLIETEYDILGMGPEIEAAKATVKMWNRVAGRSEEPIPRAAIRKIDVPEPIARRLCPQFF